MPTLTEAAEQIRARKLSPVELTRACLDRIERLNPTLNAFITITADLALEQAQQAESEIAAGNWRGPLHGIPIALKDNIDTAGVLTTAASNQYRRRVPTEDADIVRRLKDAGAVILGKTNMHEFAFGGSGIVSAFGPAHNPWDTARITGGSSSGSAVAVAAGMCLASIGTDTAGSVRCPASLCGVVGYRPSQRLLSNEGIVPLALSFDTPGPITQTVRDAVVILQVLSPIGYPAELLSTDGLDANLQGLRVSIATNLAAGVDPEVARAFAAAVEVIRDIVGEVRDVPVVVEPAISVREAEISRYHRHMLEHTPELYDRRTLPRIRNCRGVSPIQYELQYQAYKRYLQSHRLFETVDIVLSPTVPVPAPPLSLLEPLDSAALREYELHSLLRNTIPFSFLWSPSISVPCGFTAAGLPVGLQVSARPGADATVLRLAHAYQRTRAWNTHPQEELLSPQ